MKIMNINEKLNDFQKKVVEMKKREIKEKFLRDLEFTFLFYLLLVKISKGEEELNRKIKRKIDADLLSSLQKKVTEVPLQELLPVIYAYSELSPQIIGSYPEIVTFPLSIFGGYVTSVFEGETVKKLYTRIRDLVLLAAMKLKNEDRREQNKGVKIASFVFWFFIVLDEERFALSWRFLLENLSDHCYEKLLKEIFLSWFIFSEKPIEFVFLSRITHIPLKERLKEKDEGVRVHLFVPDKHLNEVEKIYGEVLAEIDKENKKIMEFLRQINEEEMRKKITDYWREIRSPYYGVRPQGKDMVEIRIPELNSSLYQINSFQFFPFKEWQDGKVRVKVNISLFGNPYSYFFTLYPGSLEMRERIYLSEDDPRKKVDLVLIYLTTRAYCEIVSGKIFIEKGPTSRSVPSDKTKSRKSLIIVRPFFRNLPPGHKASDAAIKRSREKWGQPPPPGKTFVQEHKRGGEIDSGVITILSYTAEDLKEVVKQ